MNKWGRIVSEKKHKSAKKEKRLQKYGFFTKKGKFGAVKRNSSRKTKSKKGGADEPAAAAATEAARNDRRDNGVAIRNTLSEDVRKTPGVRVSDRACLNTDASRAEAKYTDYTLSGGN